MYETRVQAQSELPQLAEKRLRYWDRLARKRLNRRALLAAGSRAGVGAAGIALVGCGGDDDDDDAAAQVSDEQQDTQDAQADAMDEAIDEGQAEASDFEQLIAEIPEAQERYPLVVQYNWRKLDWSTSPYVGGRLQVLGIPPGDYNLMTTETLTQFPMYMNGLYFSALHYGVNLDGPAVRPDLALTSEANPDITEWVFTIPENAFFHDKEPVNGDKLTAEHVKFTFDRFIDTSVWARPLRNVVRVEAPDDTTVKFVLERTELGLPNTLALPYYQVFHPTHFDDADRFSETVIGTGAFVLNSSEPFVRSEATRHPLYWDTARFLPGAEDVPLPFADEMNHDWIPDANAQDAAIRAGELDAVHMEAVRPSRVEQLLETNPDLQFATNIEWSVTQHRAYLQWNNPIFQDERVRRALSVALDRATIVDVAQEGAGVPESGPIPFDQMGLDAPPVADQMGEFWAYNPDQARELLDAAGYGDGLNLTAQFGNLGGVVPDWMPLVQEFWGRVGVNVELQGEEQLRLSTILLDKSFPEIVLTSGLGSILGYDLPTVVSPWHPESPQNWSNVDHPELTAIIDRIDNALDPDTWEDLAWEFHNKFAELQPAVYVAGYHSFFCTQPWIHTVANSAYTTILNYASNNWRNVWIDDTAPGGRGGTPA